MSGSIRVSDTRLPRLLGVALLVLALPVAAGELYQWKDANGVTHYSDSPPPGGEYENRIIGNSGSAGTAAKPEEAAAENEQCTMARANLELLAGDAPVGKDSDGDGKPDVEMTPAERDGQKRLAEAAMAVHCTPAEPSANR